MLNFSVLELAKIWLEFCVYKNYHILKIDLWFWVVNTKYLGSITSLIFWKRIFIRYLLSIAYPWRWYLSDFWSILLKKREREGNKDIYLCFINSQTDGSVI